MVARIMPKTAHDTGDLSRNGAKWVFVSMVHIIKRKNQHSLKVFDLLQKSVLLLFRQINYKHQFDAIFCYKEKFQKYF